MKVNFYLPGLSIFPKACGGYKVVYQYANYLSENGNDVHIYYDAKKGKNTHHFPAIIYYLIKKIIINPKFPYWYSVNKKVKQKVIYDISNNRVREADVSIATAVDTVYQVSNLDSQKGRKFYFIQDIDNWYGWSNEEVYKTYELDMNKIVVSKWLKKIVDKYSAKEAILVPNGIDINNTFKVKNKIENRKNHSIVMLYHTEKRKNSEFGISLIKRLKEKYQDLDAHLFGFPNRPDNLPAWIKYSHNLNENEVSEVMNENSVFICTSLKEGYGLPGIEAMACGCALVTTDCEGILEYANSENSMISNIDNMYNNICKLFDNEEKRIEIAYSGVRDIKSFDLNIACKKFEKMISQNT